MDAQTNIDGSTCKASIIVPCYKVEKYLPRCLDSLMAQSLSDIEVICINDGSPDNCLAILRDYETRYPGKIVVIDKPNEGVWRGRQDAIAIARGEYIGFVDSDDYVEPDFCEQLYRAAEDNHADISACGFYREDFDTGDILNEEMTDQRAAFSVGSDPALLLQMNGAPWNKFFAAHVLKGMYDFEKPPRIFDDMMMHLLVFPRVERIAFTPRPLVHYIIRNDSIMTTIDKSKIDSTYEAMIQVRDYYREQKVGADLLAFLDAAAFLHMGISLMFRISYDKTANLSEALAQNRTYLDREFSGWRTSDMISFKNAREYGGALTRVWLGKVVYRAHLMGPALHVYRFLIDKMGIDIKW